MINSLFQSSIGANLFFNFNYTNFFVYLTEFYSTISLKKNSQRDGSLIRNACLIIKQLYGYFATFKKFF